MDRKEARFWKKVSNSLSRSVFRRRIENCVAVGDPDVLLMCDGIVRQVELKFVAEPVRETSILLGSKGLNVDQVNYHLEWASKGGTSFVLVGTNLRVYLLPGAMAVAINNLSVAECKSKSLIRDLIELEERMFPK